MWYLCVAILLLALYVRLLNHRYITRLYDVFESKNHIYMVMELVDGGELFDHIIQQVSFIRFVRIQFFFLEQIFGGNLEFELFFFLNCRNDCGGMTPCEYFDKLPKLHRTSIDMALLTGILSLKTCYLTKTVASALPILVWSRALIVRMQKRLKTEAM